jgi:hypothetical protein
MSNGNIRWISAAIPEEDFDAINELCSLLGFRQKFVITDLVHIGLEEKVQGLKKPNSELLLWKAVNEIERQSRIRTMLERLGYEAKLTGDTEIADLFDAHCQEFGYDPADLMSRIDTTTGPPQVNFKSRGTSVDACEEWLRRKMVPGVPVAQPRIMTEARNIGFKKYAVDQAKRRIGIISQNAGKHWEWIWPVGDTVQIIEPIELPDEEDLVNKGNGYAEVAMTQQAD